MQELTAAAPPDTETNLGSLRESLAAAVKAQADEAVKAGTHTAGLFAVAINLQFQHLAVANEKLSGAELVVHLHQLESMCEEILTDHLSTPLSPNLYVEATATWTPKASE